MTLPQSLETTVSNGNDIYVSLQIGTIAILLLLLRTLKQKLRRLDGFHIIDALFRPRFMPFGND
jgi:hypothetical protein